MARPPRSRVTHEPDAVSGTARIDIRTKRIVKRISPGEIMVIDHGDLDRVAAETIVAARAGAVLQPSHSIPGPYPIDGPHLPFPTGLPRAHGAGPQDRQGMGEGG